MEKQLSKERELLDEWNRQIGWVIPGGSEYIDDPKRCAEAIRHRYNGDMHMKDVMHRKHLEWMAEKDALITQLSEAARLAQRKIDYAILNTPSSEERDELTAINIQLLAAIQKATS